MPVADGKGRIVAACVARPAVNDESQGEDYLEAERTLTQNFRVINITVPEHFGDHKKKKKKKGGRKKNKKKKKDNRRGDYNSVHAGVSMGGGQTVCLFISTSTF